MSNALNAPARARGGASRDSDSEADPFAGVLALGPRIPVGVMVAALVLALSLHAGAAAAAVQAAMLHAFAAWASDVKTSVSLRLAQTYEIDVSKPVEKPAEPPPPPEEKEEPKPTIKEPSKDEPPPPPPAAAEAAKVLMQDPSPDEPVDLTGNTFLAGSAETAVGGVTQIGGKATAPTQNAAAVATGTPGGTGKAAAPAAKVDRSRPAGIVNKSNLERCPFPAEADAEQVDEAVVGIEVRVGPDGRPETATVTRDPGHGFGREARKCALREKYSPALDTDGNALPGVYRVNFRFSR